MRYRVSALVATLALFAGTVTAAVDSAPRTIDVVVTDAAGHHLTGLAQSDFQIFEDGKPRDIARFAEQTTAPGAADTQPPRNILLLIDSSSISLAARKTTIAAFRDLVSTRIRPIDKVMVATIQGLGAVLPGTWTSDKEKLLQDLAKAEQASVGNKTFDRREVERSIQTELSVDRQATEDAKNNRGPLTNSITFDTLMETGRHYAETARQRAQAQAGAIGEAIAYLGNGPGKKIAVIAGGGLSARPGSDIFEFLENEREQVLAGAVGGDGAIRGAQGANPRSEESRYEISDEIRALALSARDRGITIYTIDPENSGSSDSSIERTEMTNGNSEFAGVADMLSGYQILTGTTGGLPIGARFSAGAEIAKDLDAHYLLTYAQTLDEHGRLRKLEVRTTKPGARLRFGYTGGPGTKDAEVKDAVVANHSAAQLSNDMQISIVKEAPVADGDKRRVKLHVRIPMKSLKFVPSGDQVAAGFAVYIATGDDKGNSSKVDRQSQDLRFPAAQLAQVLNKTIDFNVDVVIGAGKNQVSIGVMDQQSQQTGYAKTTI
jgi:VWFA-related protein